MPDRAKIIQALELCDGVYKCPESCPYWGKEPCGINADILALLKEQEPVDPKTDKMRNRICPKCNTVLRGRFCHECGKKVKWE